MDTINVVNVGGIDKEIEDTTARTRIDEIIAPTGGAPNPEEIVDARIGDDNTLYPNLGAAIRNPIKFLRDVSRNGLNHVDTDMNFSFTPLWLSGKDLSSQTGDIVSNADYSVADFIGKNRVDGLQVTIGAQNIHLYIYQYDSSKVFLSNKKIDISSSGKINLDTSCEFVRLCTKSVNLDYISFSIPEKETVDTTARDAITNFIDDVKKDTDNGTNVVDEDGNVLFYPLWRSGDLDGQTGEIIPNPEFIVTDFVDKSRLNSATVAISQENTNLYVYQYNSSGYFLSDKKIVIGSTTVLELDNACRYVRLCTKESNFGHIKFLITKIPPDYFEEWLISDNPEWEFVRELGDINSQTGENQPDNSFLRSAGFVDVDQIYGLKINIVDNVSLHVCVYDKNQNFLFHYSKNSSFTFKKTVGSGFVRFSTKITNISQQKISFERSLGIAKAEELKSLINEMEIVFNIMDYMDVGAGNLSGTVERNKDCRVNVKLLKIVKHSYFSVDSGSNLYVYEYDSNFNLVKRNDHPAHGEKYYVDDATCYLRFETTNDLRTGLNVTVVSEKPYPEFVYDKYRGYDTIKFYYNVFINHDTDKSDVDTDQNTDGVFTSGALRLPPNYNPNGEKVPLIYFVHGSGDYHHIYISNDGDMTSLYMDYIRYLQDEGFAVFDCFANTIAANQSGNGCQWGVPSNMAAAKQGIEYCCRNFNIDENSIFVMSKSLGGLVAINMCYESGINIKACCPLAPELDMVCDALGYNTNVRKFNANDMSFSEDVNNVLDEDHIPGTREHTWQYSSEFKDYIRENARCLAGYNPIWKGIIGLDYDDLIEYSLVNDRPAYGQKIATLNRFCQVPTKIMIAVDDPAVSYDMSAGYIQSLKNCGCVGELRTLPANSGKHHAVDTEGPMVSSIKTKLGIIHTDVPLAYVETVQFFNRYK